MFSLRRGLALAAVVVLSAARFVESAAGNIDDLFSLLVYVRHFAASGSFYYNAADGPIDGFTSPLDLLFKAAAQVVVRGDPVLIAWWLSLALHVGVGVAGFLIAERLARRRGLPGLWLATIAGIALGTAQALGDGSAFLLETPLFVLLGLAACAIVVLEPPSSRAGRLGVGALLIAVTLARPEGLPLSLLLLALLYFERRDAWPLALFAAGIGAYYAWRVHVFGFWAPNTYYAKTSASRWYEIRDGLDYVLAFARSLGAPSLLWIAAAPLVAGARFVAPPHRRAYVACCALAWAMLGVVVYSGGDCYAGGRFLALPLALATLALVIAAATLDGRARTAARGALAALTAAQLLVLIATPIYVFGVLQPREPLRIPLRGDSFACERDASEQIAAPLRRRPGAVVAQTDFQRFKFFVDDLESLDLTGLNDRRIAHRRIDGPVRWGKLDVVEAARLRPEVLILGHHTTVNARAIAAFPLAEVFRDAALQDDFFGYGVSPAAAEALTASYAPASVPVCGGWFNFLARRDLASAWPAPSARATTTGGAVAANCRREYAEARFGKNVDSEKSARMIYRR